MKLLDLILFRRTAHTFSNAAVSNDLIEKAMLAGIYAPNHRQTWPWKFFLVGPKSRMLLAELQAELKSKKSRSEFSESMRHSVIEKYLTPGALIILALKKTFDVEQAKEDYASLACAAQNMMLLFADEGFASKWSTGDILKKDETYKILAIDKNEIEIHGFLWVGKAKEEPAKPERPPLNEFIQYLE